MIQRRNYLKRSPLKRKPAKRPAGFADPEYLAWLRTWPCYVCLFRACVEQSVPFWKVITNKLSRDNFVNGTMWECGRTEAAHVGTRGLRQKCKDREAMPLGQKHHLHQTAGGGPESHHSLGGKFWEHHGLERESVIAILNELYHQETGK
jgi:hypothetical protein